MNSHYIAGADQLSSVFIGGAIGGAPKELSRFFLSSATVVGYDLEIIFTQSL